MANTKTSAEPVASTLTGVEIVRGVQASANVQISINQIQAKILTGTAAAVTTNANLTGPVTSVGNATAITDAAVTYAKMQNVTTARLHGRVTAGAGPVEEIPLGANMSFVGGALTAATASTGLTSFTEGLSAASPNDTVPVVSFRAINAAANVDVAIVPKGLGAFTLSVANSLSSGGNKRGMWAVDLQMQRSGPLQVASGSGATLLGGTDGTASGANSIAGGGTSATATGNSSIALGGANNVASGASAVILGGTNNTASGIQTFIAVGDTNTASARWASVINGSANVADGEASLVGGFNAKARGIACSINWAGSYRAVFGDRTITPVLPLACNTTTSTTPAILTSDGTTATVNNVLTLPDNSSVKFRATVVARNTSTNATATWEIVGVAKRSSGVATTVLLGTPTVTQDFADAAMSTAAVAVLADTTLGAVTLRVTGIAAITIAWNASMFNIVLNG